MRVFKVKGFVRFARRADVGDAALLDAVRRADQGLIDADLGGGLIKMRIARPGQGRSGGFRTVLAFRKSTVAIFLYGFAKNERDNIGAEELATLKELATALLCDDGRGLVELARAKGAEEIVNE